MSDQGRQICKQCKLFADDCECYVHECPECHDDGSECETCCEHGDFDHAICGICGKDCTNMLAGQAEDAWEGDR
jgi:hypothetical protein